MNNQERTAAWAAIERLIRNYKQSKGTGVRNKILYFWSQFPESEGKEWTAEEIIDAVEKSNAKRIADKEKVVFEPL